MHALWILNICLLKNNLWSEQEIPRYIYFFPFNNFSTELTDLFILVGPLVSVERSSPGSQPRFSATIFSCFLFPFRYIRLQTFWCVCCKTLFCYIFSFIFCLPFLFLCLAETKLLHYVAIGDQLIKRQTNRMTAYSKMLKKGLERWQWWRALVTLTEDPGFDSQQPHQVTHNCLEVQLQGSDVSGLLQHHTCLYLNIHTERHINNKKQNNSLKRIKQVTNCSWGTFDALMGIIIEFWAIFKFAHSDSNLLVVYFKHLFVLGGGSAYL